MATDRSLKVTKGPCLNKLMLALFDPTPCGCVRTVTFTLESHEHKFLKTLRKCSNRYQGLTAQENLEVEICDQDIGPHDYEMMIHIIERCADGTWNITGWNPDYTELVKIERYSTERRTGDVTIELCAASSCGEEPDFAFHM